MIAAVPLSPPVRRPTLPKSKKSVLVPGGGSGGLKSKPRTPTPKKPAVKKPTVPKKPHSQATAGHHPTKPTAHSGRTAHPKKSKLVPSHAKPSAHKPAKPTKAVHKPTPHHPAPHKPAKPAKPKKSIPHGGAKSKKSVLVPGNAAKRPHHGNKPSHPSIGATKGKASGQNTHLKPPKKKAAGKPLGGLVKRIKLRKGGAGGAT